MSISASQIVSVTPRVINAGGTDLEITGLLLTGNELCVFPGTLSFTSASAVASYFGSDSDEYLAAAKYFLGYDNSFAKPQKLHFARLVTEAIAGTLIGGTAASLSELQAVTAGAFTITVDGEEKSVTGVDLSGVTTQSEAAEILEEAIGGVTVEYNSNLNAFVVTSATTGADSSVSAAEDSEEEYQLAALLGLTAATGAVVSEGSDALTPTANMNSITSVTQNWVSFTTMDEADEETVLELAQWANDSDGEYLYCPWTTSENDTNPNADSNLPKLLANYDYEGVLLTFGALEYAVFAMSIAACIDWDRTNGIVTWAFKSQDGLAASVADDNTADDCVELKVNFYGRYATRNDDFIFYYSGVMSGGDFGYVDAYVGNLWLRNALQVSIVNGLNQVGRVPYTNAGYTLIKAWCADPINRALTNGVIDTGVEISEAQRAQIMSEVGEDVSSQIMTDGYYLLVSDPGASARVNRETPTMGLWYTYGGSVHNIELPVTAIL